MRFPPLPTSRRHQASPQRRSSSESHTIVITTRALCGGGVHGERAALYTLTISSHQLLMKMHWSLHAQSGCRVFFFHVRFNLRLYHRAQVTDEGLNRLCLRVRQC